MLFTITNNLPMRIFQILLISYLPFNCVNVFAQKTATETSQTLQSSLFKLTKGEDIMTMQSLDDKGFFLSTGVKKGVTIMDLTLHKFDNDFNKIWSSTILKKLDYAKYSKQLIASSQCDWAYYFIIPNTNKLASTSSDNIIVRIDKDGKTETFQFISESNTEKLLKSPKNNSMLPKEKSDDNSLLQNKLDEIDFVASFVDDEHLYVLCMFYSYSKVKKVKMKESQLILFKLSNSSHTFERIETQMKLEGEENDDLFIEYLGHDDENIYLSRKTVDFSEKTIKYTLFTTDKSGVNTDETEFLLELNTLPVAAKNYRQNFGGLIFDNDYRVEVISRSNQVTTIYYPYDGVYGCSQLNQHNGYFYIYGLSKKDSKSDSKKDSKKKLQLLVNSSNMNNEADNVYIGKFDFTTGELIQKQELPLPKEMRAEDELIVPSLFTNRIIGLESITNDLVRFVGYTATAMTYSTSNSLQFGKKTIKNKGDAAPSGSYHTITIDLASGKSEYASMPFERKMGYSKPEFVTCLYPSKIESTKDYTNFIKKYPTFRTKEYSVVGMNTNNTRIVMINNSFSKKLSIEFYKFPYKGIENK